MNGKKSERKFFPMSVTYSAGCDPNAIQAYLDRATRAGATLRAFRLYRKGETASADLAPYRPDDRQHLYSLSKSFTSVAVGIAQDRGLLRTDERMLDIFPECAPPEISENLAEMTLGDVLSMQSGHEVCHLDKMRFSEDAVRTFLAMPVVYKPGTKFVYSTGGTCVCGAAVEKRAGMPFADFLQKYLFDKLEIPRPRAIFTADGHHCGGIGIYLSVDEVYRFGRMLLSGGVYGGERVVSEAYLRKATSHVADTTDDGSEDWNVGYGYQFWRNVRGGFRGDGAFGQLCVVLPEEDTVFVQFAELGNMQAELSSIYELLDGIGENPSGPCGDFADCHSPLPGGRFEPKTYAFAPNPAGVRAATLTVGGDGVLTVRFDTDYGVQLLRAGGGKWTESAPMLKLCRPSIAQLDPHHGWVETLRVRSSFAVEGDSVRVVCRHGDAPHTQTLVFSPDALRLTVNVGDQPVGELRCR